MIYLGTCIAPVGQGKDGELCTNYQLTLPDGQIVNDRLTFGDVRLYPLGADQRATITVQPAKQVNMGAGPGVPMTKEVQGGVVGLLLDGRGRPLRLPADQQGRVAALTKWFNTVGLYPEQSTER